MRRNAHVFPGNSGASTLGNRAGEGELNGGQPIRFHNARYGESRH